GCRRGVHVSSTRRITKDARHAARLHSRSLSRAGGLEQVAEQSRPLDAPDRARRRIIAEAAEHAAERRLAALITLVVVAAIGAVVAAVIAIVAIRDHCVGPMLSALTRDLGIFVFLDVFGHLILGGVLRVVVVGVLDLALLDVVLRRFGGSRLDRSLTRGAALG